MKRPVAAIVLLAPLLTSCIYLPHTEVTVDPECGVLERKMHLTVTEVALYGRCVNEGCVALLVSAGAASAATAVVSGSVVVAGNAVYWLEKQGRCLRERLRAPDRPPMEPVKAAPLPP
ncbi:hypothetical protein B9N43_04150 [Denitratisoma sp. DHT3]|uniref:hypothetical protein n=1 Tax=Denitratisoma sp. DHT3 TaxID=1981880 RepID=UPI0011983CD6|nr:hypothetical protein [Denitratisoma sp. DHT3]QDX80514.1 hypothetical protein B9N43_04150 [Denitratisoma sp. DHT3]